MREAYELLACKEEGTGLFEEPELMVSVEFDSAEGVSTSMFKEGIGLPITLKPSKRASPCILPLMKSLLRILMCYLFIPLFTRQRRSFNKMDSRFLSSLVRSWGTISISCGPLLKDHVDD